MKENYDINTISVNDVLHVLKECNRDWKDEYAIEHFITFTSKLTGIAEDRLVQMIEGQIMIKANEMRKITENNGDVLEKLFNEKVECFERRIKESAKKGESEVFFTYIQGGTPFNDRRLYEKLKDYFVSNGFRIIQYDTKYDGCGMMREYAKEYITW